MAADHCFMVDSKKSEYVLNVCYAFALLFHF